MFKQIKQQFKEGKTFLQFSVLKSLGLGLGTIAPLVIAKYFEPTLFGSYSLARMIIFFFTTMLISSAQTPFIVFANQERAATGKINKTFSVQCLYVLSSVIVFILLNLIFYKQLLTFTKISETEFFYMILAFIGITIKSFVCNFFLAAGKRPRNSFAELIFGFSVCFLIFVFRFFGTINLNNAFLIYFISGIVTSLLVFNSIEIKQIRPFTFQSRHAMEMFDFTKWLILGSTAVYFINWGDNLVLRYYGTMEDIGVYNVAYQIFKGVVMLTTIVSVYFLPFVSENVNNTEKIKRYLYSKRIKLMVLCSAFIFLIFIISPYLLIFFYQDTYKGSIWPLRVLLIGSVFVLWCSFYGPIFSSFKLYKVTQPIAVVHVLVNILLDIIMVPRMGIMGAAAATTIAYFLHLIMMECVFRVKLKKLF